MSLQVFVGPMFSGKTTELLRVISKYSDVSNDRPLLINHSFDIRNTETKISSHSSQYFGISNKISSQLFKEVKQKADF